MSGDGHQLPIGQKITLAGHFDSPVTLESVRLLAGGYECRVRLSDGTMDEAVISAAEAATLTGTLPHSVSTVQPADAAKLRLLVESTRIRLTS